MVPTSKNDKPIRRPSEKMADSERKPDEFVDKEMMGPEGLSVDLQNNYQCSKYKILDAVFYALSVVIFIGSAITG